MSEEKAQHFLNLIKQSKRGKFKIYIGMSAGVGKTYRMLQDAHALQRNGIDVKIGFVETHFREETHQLLDGLTAISTRTIFYKGKELEEMDVQAIINEHPEVVLVDEIAHSNVHGSKNEKRWQDVMEILDVGINVISAVNIQHLESLNQQIIQITGIEVKERIPDSVLAMADEVVNIDLTADELIERLQQGKIYTADKIQQAVNNFFKINNILQLRELALKEVASQVVRKVEQETNSTQIYKTQRIMACISANENTSKGIIRKVARLANYYNAKWYVLYIQTGRENSNRIPLDKQRHLINSFKLATEMGAEIIRIQDDDIASAIAKQTIDRQITTLCIGKPQFSFFSLLFNTNFFKNLMKKISEKDVDIVILST
nr:sensor protein KdpD [uncultured Pedobacter sp.]